MRKAKFIGLLIIACILGVGHGAPARAGDAFVNYAALGRAKFTQKKYDEAIDLFRKHLRRAPKDYNVWSQLGAAYYHSGQPRKGLRYLKHVERQTSEKSYNYYYQGLCYLAADTPDKAKEFLTYAAQRYTDEYASRATFEVAVLEYNAKNKPRATYWLTSYEQKYATGVYAAQAQRLLTSLKENRFIEGVEGTKKPDMEEALFKYNKLSLSPHPHYWFVQGGWQYADHTGFEPAEGGGIKPRAFQDMAGLAAAGVGIGPIRQSDMTVFAGYTYRQAWNTDQDRIAQWTADPTSIEYFPLRGDLMERHHQLYADFRRDVAGWFYYGLYARYEISKIGSSLLPSPDSQDLRHVLPISETQLAIPWVGFSYAGNMRTLGYMYLRKELNDDDPQYSNKSYDLGTSGGSPVLSFGVSHTMDFPEENLGIDIELFQYEFIYNDYWLDYKRQGAFIGAEEEFIPRWVVNALVGYYSDIYVLPRLKDKSCNSVTEEAASSAGGQPTGQPIGCKRTDTGLMYQAGIYWNWTQFHRVSAFYQTVQNQNPTMKEYQESKTTIQATFTMAFPSVARVSRLVDRYADTAFTKEAQ